jgi:hypothetical protein
VNRYGKHPIEEDRASTEREEDGRRGNRRPHGKMDTGKIE